MVNHVKMVGKPLTTTNEPIDFSGLIAYKTSTTAVRWFCKRCSAHILWHYIDPENWCVAVGALERTEGIVKNGYHIWVGDTLDGGIADHLKVIDGVELPRYTAGAEAGKVVPLGWRSPDAPENTETRSEDRLHAHCHCESVSFWITRPSAAPAQPSSPYPDLMYAYDSTPAETVANPADEKWWLRPVGAAQPTHYLAGHCACTSCRLTSGFDIQSWAFVPRANILVPRSIVASAPGVEESAEGVVELNLQDEELRIAGLRRYRSSTGRNREFCGTCGATVFWWGEERPDLVDVSVGLVGDNQGGARAEGWFEWHKGRVSFEEDAVNKTLVQGLVNGLREISA
ncbi:putative glutathione-dependent formaldehyde-activating enzyme [Lyophyllum shimeji]|uniref:Glutathione-dependent formaldehyde-activating enzyme n=1 Tax=Lyophyllum shimeji TaxID=47721 RepID=A0A9P3PUI6_LYOSH|nr:putative glutathione-dependent formaldehyde-activating enzyme [Lyophyllum shimeji]